MNTKVLGIVLLVLGAVVLFYGMQAGDAFASEVKEAIDGTPTDRAMGLTIGGVVLGVAGLGLLLKGRK